MGRRYFIGTTLAVMEGEMMQIPNFEKRGVGISSRPRHWYSKADMNCQHCADHSKKGCTHRCCPWLIEKLEVGALALSDLANICFENYKNCRFRVRLAHYLAKNEPVRFIDEYHRRRFESASAWTWYGRGNMPPKFAAALYLLTADVNLWWRAQEVIYRENIDFAKFSLRGIGIDSYTLVKEARALYNKKIGVTMDELATPEIINDTLFGCVVTAILLSQYGVAVLCKTMGVL